MQQNDRYNQAICSKTNNAIEKPVYKKSDSDVVFTIIGVAVRYF